MLAAAACHLPTPRFQLPAVGGQLPAEGFWQPADLQQLLVLRARLLMLLVLPL